MTRKARLFAAAALSTLTLSFAAAAALHHVEAPTYKVDGTATSKIGGPSLEVDGSGPFRVREEEGKLIFTADLKVLDMAKRTDHMKHDFHVAKHPNALLIVDKEKLKMPEDNKKVAGNVTASLKFHGKAKNVQLSYTAKRTGNDYHVKDATFKFNYTDFGMEKVCRYGMCVDSEVKITVPYVKIRND